MPGCPAFDVVQPEWTGQGDGENEGPWWALGSGLCAVSPCHRVPAKMPAYQSTVHRVFFFILNMTRLCKLLLTNLIFLPDASLWVPCPFNENGMSFWVKTYLSKEASRIKFLCEEAAWELGNAPGTHCVTRGQTCVPVGLFPI